MAGEHQKISSSKILMRGEVPPPCSKSRFGDNHIWKEVNPNRGAQSGLYHEVCQLCKQEQIYDTSD